jgi:DNA-binding XRE family transcriptional regulator
VSIGFYEKVFVFVIKKERGISMVFKERLKEKRTEANLTQVELAEKAGVTARTIQNYELGSRKPIQYGYDPEDCGCAEYYY